MSASDTQDLWFIAAWVIGAWAVWWAFKALRGALRSGKDEALAKSAGALTAAAQAKATRITEAFKSGRSSHSDP